MKKNYVLLGAAISISVVVLAIWIPTAAQGPPDSQPEGAPAGSDSNPTGAAEVRIPARYQPGAASDASAASAATIYFTPQDENTSTTVIFLYNTGDTTATVGLQTFGLDGALYIDTSILVPADGLVRICGDEVVTISWTWQDVVLVNFTTASTYGKMTLPEGVHAEAYVVWNGGDTYDPLQIAPTLPIRFSTEPPTAALPVTLTGQVSDALTLTPLEGAEVTADPGPTVTTGPDGVYTMTLAAGVYDVTAAASGYLSQTITGLEVLTGTVVQNFRLEPIPALSVTLTGQVSDALTPLEGAQVMADSGPTAATGPDGVYTMTLAPGVYDVTAAAGGYLSQTIAGLEVLTGTVVQNFALEPLLCPEPTIRDVQVLTDDLTATFTAAISFTPPISYLWAFGDGATSSLPAPTHTYAAYGVYPFTLTVTDGCGADVWSDQIVLPSPPLRIYLSVVHKLQT